MQKFTLKNFEKYQAQRRGKNVPWVKLYVNFDEDWAIGQLTDAEVRQWVGLICVASKQGPELRWDAVWLKRAIGCKGSLDLNKFEKLGLIQKLDDQDGFNGTPSLAEGNGREVKGSEVNIKPVAAVKKEKPKKKKTEPRNTVPLQRVIDLYHDLFLGEYKHKPIINGKHAKLLKPIVDKLGEEEASDLMRRFFATEDRFIIEAGHTIEIFQSQVNKLICQRSGRKPQEGKRSVLHDIDLSHMEGF